MLKTARSRLAGIADTAERNRKVRKSNKVAKNPNYQNLDLEAVRELTNL